MHPALRPYLENLWTFDQTNVPSGWKRYPPRGSVNLMIGVGSPIMMGWDERPASAEPMWGVVVGTTPRPGFADPSQAGIDISLTAAGLQAFTGIPPAAIYDQQVNLSDLFGPSADRLIDRLQQTPVAGRWRVVENYLLSRLHRRRDPRVSPASRLVDAIVAAGGRVRVDDLAGSTGWSPRHLRTLVRREAGAGPKTFARLRKGRVGGSSEQITAPSGDLYGARTILAQQRIVELDLMSNTFMRAPGETQGTFALESAVDELAIRLAMDPLDLRLRNQPGPRRPVGRARYSHHRVPELYAAGRDLFGWADRPEPMTRDGKDLVGWGVATAVHGALVYDAKARLTIDLTGRVVFESTAQEIGVGVATVTGQLVADAVGVPFDRVTVEYADSNLPEGPIAGGLVQTATLAAAAERGAAELRRQLDELADRSGLPAGSDPVDVLARAGQASLTVSVGHERGLRAGMEMLAFAMRTGRDMLRYARAATGAHFCEVRVDADTGELRVTRWLGVFDIGRVVNPKTAASQLRGGIVMGLGMAMGEDSLVDPRTARIMNPSLAEYHVPVHADVPRIDIQMLDDPDPTMPSGVVGAGEVSITGVAAAVANAVRHATGRRITRLPITLDTLV